MGGRGASIQGRHKRLGKSRGGEGYPLEPKGLSQPIRRMRDRNPSKELFFTWTVFAVQVQQGRMTLYPIVSSAR